MQLCPSGPVPRACRRGQAGRFAGRLAAVDKENLLLERTESLLNDIATNLSSFSLEDCLFKGTLEDLDVAMGDSRMQLLISACVVFSLLVSIGASPETSSPHPHTGSPLSCTFHISCFRYVFRLHSLAGLGFPLHVLKPNRVVPGCGICCGRLREGPKELLDRG